MRIQKTFCVMTTFVFISLWTVGVSSQSDNEPTPIPQETLDAAVNMLFQQTADAIINQTATAGAAPDETATAQALIAPTQTLEALFQQAMTATAQATIPNYDDYAVTDVQELPLLAAPAQTAAHLSPDGTQFLHIHGQTFCFYAPDENNVWLETQCEELDRSISGSDAEEFYWSPDSRWLALPTYREGFVFLRDTDIRVMNTETFEVLTLTEDNTDDNLIDDGFNGYFDILPRWRDDNTLLFLRFMPESEGSDNYRVPYLMQIRVPDGEAEEVGLMAPPIPFGIYVLATSNDGMQIGYNADPRDNEPEQGIWIMSLDDLSPEQVIAIEENERLPMNLAFSANNRYLMNLNSQAASRDPASVIEIVDLENGEIIPFAAGQIVIGAGWSPRGNAIAYLVRDRAKPESSGLYITTAPGEPGRQILQGDFYPPTCCMRMPLEWADNDTILIGRGSEPGILLVKVSGES